MAGDESEFAKKKNIGFQFFAPVKFVQTYLLGAGKQR